MTTATRILLASDPFADPDRKGWVRGNWPARWIRHSTQAGPAFTAYRLRLRLDTPVRARIHVSADERYRLFLDGERIGEGPERGDVRHWNFESHDLDLPAGDHTFVAVTWWLGTLDASAPTAYAQHSVRPAFLLAAEGAATQLLSTGLAAWEAGEIAGVTFTSQRMAWGTPARVHIDGRAWPWGVERGDGGLTWSAAVASAKAISLHDMWQAAPAWLLTPARLPAADGAVIRVGTARHVATWSGDADRIAIRSADHRAEEAEAWTRMVRGDGAATVASRSRRRVLIDLGEYRCAYPELTTSGGAGASVSMIWVEALFHEPEGRTKGQRDAIEGLHVIGVGPAFVADGGKTRTFTTPWWEAGRFIERRIETADAPLTIDSLALRPTGYPFTRTSSFASSDARLGDAVAAMERTMRACMHETYMDCPYYEQLQYVGDTRLECLTTFAMTRDHRLPAKALALFDWSRTTEGFTTARYPSATSLSIPTFSLIWVAMVHDRWQWSVDPAAARAHLAGVRAVLSASAACTNADGLIAGMPGWNFMDWVPAWIDGTPPNGDRGASASINWLWVYALRRAAELEEALGEPELAALDRRQADAAVTALDRHFWSEERGMYADDVARTLFSEHAQSLALLSGIRDPRRRESVAEGLLTAPDLARATIYFSHYLFEAFAAIGRVDALLARMPYWFDLAGQGFTTTPEMPEPSRSDCHAWGAHPYFHYFATILGIRPAAPGFARVIVRPQLGGLEWAEGIYPHPAGDLRIEIRHQHGVAVGIVTLPPGVEGTLIIAGIESTLKAGENRFGMGRGMVGKERDGGGAHRRWG